MSYPTSAALDPIVNISELIGQMGQAFTLSDFHNRDSILDFLLSFLVSTNDCASNLSVPLLDGLNKLAYRGELDACKRLVSVEMKYNLTVWTLNNYIRPST